MRSAALLSLALIAACPDEPVPLDPDAGGLTPESFCQQLLDALFQRRAACYGGSAGYAASEAAKLYPLCSTQVPPSVAAGRARFVPAQAQACLGWIPTAGCMDVRMENWQNGPPSPCSSALGGATSSGAACYSGWECASGLFCSAEWALECPGTCQAVPAVGQDCSAAPCAPTAYCDGSGLCAPFAPLNQACGGPTGVRCSPELACVGGLCVQRSTASCSSTAECAWGQYCDSGIACAPLRTLGQTCAAGQRQCEPGAWCDAGSGTCQAANSTGGLCGTTPSGETMGCLASHCSATVCTAYLGPGGDCSGAGRCRADLVCNGTTCVAFCPSP